MILVPALISCGQSTKTSKSIDSREAVASRPPVVAPQPAAPGTSATVQGPCVRVQESMYQFVDAAEEGIVVHEFKLQNTGTAVLEIRKVVPS